MPLLSATVLVCESALEEKTGVYSAVRISDVLEYRLTPDIPPERQTIQATVLAILRFSADDNGEYVAQIRAKRPDGTEVNLGDPLSIPLARIKITRPGMTRTVTVAADLRIVPRDGIHRIHLLLDEQEVTGFAFTIRSREAQLPEDAVLPEDTAAHDDQSPPVPHSMS